MDFIDTAIFIKENELTDLLGVIGLGESGSITALASIFQEPFLFESCAVLNPVVDLTSHMLYDIEERDSTLSALEHEQRVHDKIEEFGDPMNRLFYESHKLISPYHVPFLDETQMHTDLLVCVDENNPMKYHARKLIAKIRSVYEKDNSWAFYNEFREKSMLEREKQAVLQSFIINTLLFG